MHHEHPLICTTNTRLYESQTPVHMRHKHPLMCTTNTRLHASQNTRSHVPQTPAHMHHKHPLICTKTPSHVRQNTRSYVPQTPVMLITNTRSYAPQTLIRQNTHSCIKGSEGKFYSSKRLLTRKVNAIKQDFWSAVTHTVSFSLQQFNLDKTITFRFLNPIWAWLMAAQRFPPEDLQWLPYVQRHPVSGERLYGGGVQFGKAFSHAYKSCPRGTYPMLFNLHWDGTNAHGVWCTPIAVGNANINGQSTAAHVCIAYLPSLSGMGRQFTKTKLAKKVKHYILQKCIGEILSVLEEGASRGVRCTVNLGKGATSTLLYPRLIATSLDQVEAQAYYGKNTRPYTPKHPVVYVKTPAHIHQNTYSCVSKHPLICTTNTRSCVPKHPAVYVKTPAHMNHKHPLIRPKHPVVCVKTPDQV